MAENKNEICPDLPIDTRPITKQDFLKIVERYRGDPLFKKLPLPAFAYDILPEYQGTELGRLSENSEYAIKQMSCKTEEERKANQMERLRKKIEERKAQQKK